MSQQPGHVAEIMELKPISQQQRLDHKAKIKEQLRMARYTESVAEITGDGVKAL